MADTKLKVVCAIVDFLRTSIADGTVAAQDAESLDVAIQCISESFALPSPLPDTLSIAPHSLLSIFSRFLTDSAIQHEEPALLPVDKEKAEKLKSDGNSLMSTRSYSAAVDKYSLAIQIDPLNPVYYSNRAAAYSQLNQHQLAIEDALKASEIDPSFAKAYSRLGHAYFSNAQYQKSVEAYQKALELDQNNSTIKASLATARSKLSSSASSSTLSRDAPVQPGSGSGMPDLGGPGGANLASLMNNPMMAQMAQGLMANGGLERMMQNPMVQQMMNSLQSGQGGLPDIAQLMNNPAAREMAASLMGGAGRGPTSSDESSDGPGRGDSGNNNSDMFS